MARTTNTLILGLSGKLGNELVFRQYSGKTFVTKAPAKYPPPTAAQQVQQSKFQQAMIYWKGIKNNPELLAGYKAAATNGQRGVNIAIADFIHAPDIKEVDLAGYTGLPGQVIRIKVTDDFQVKAVKLTIQNEDGTLVEEGFAEQNPKEDLWIYNTTANNDNLAGDKITVTATDNPDNLASQELTIL